jgi:hypothetical protein
MLLSRNVGQLCDLRLSERGDVLTALWGLEPEVREWVVLAQPITQGVGPHGAGHSCCIA